jgi:hypothetical protein
VIYNRFVFNYRNTVPISIVQSVVSYASMSKWHSDRINQVRKNIVGEFIYFIFQRLSELASENETIDLDQYSKIMQLLDLNPNLINVRSKRKRNKQKFCFSGN